MSQQAHVSSVETLENFRTGLVIYLSQARPALDEVGADVVRMRAWLETDQRLFWENQVRRLTKELDAAQQALFSVRIGAFRTEASTEQLLVHRAKRALEGAEEKLRVLKRWNRDYDNQVQPLLKEIEKLHNIFSTDMVKALAYLTQAISTLAAYAERAAPLLDTSGATRIPGSAAIQPPEPAGAPPGKT